jgi:transcriptional regulator with XRE-family HTH domain
MKYSNKVSNKIAKIRHDRNYTLTDFANLIDMNRSTYHDKEIGKSEFTISEIEKIAFKLNEPISCILGAESNNIKTESSIVIFQQINFGTNNLHLNEDLVNVIKDFDFKDYFCKKDI